MICLRKRPDRLPRSTRADPQAVHHVTRGNALMTAQRPGTYHRLPGPARGKLCETSFLPASQEVPGGREGSREKSDAGQKTCGPAIKLGPELYNFIFRHLDPIFIQRHSILPRARRIAASAMAATGGATQVDHEPWPQQPWDIIRPQAVLRCRSRDVMCSIRLSGEEEGMLSALHGWTKTALTVCVSVPAHEKRPLC